MRNKPEVQYELQIEILRNDIANLEGLVYQEIARTQDLIRQLHTEMWNMTQSMNGSQAESIGLSTVTRISSEMEKVRGEIGNMRQDLMSELRRQS
jgi:hypothetical protein